MVKDVYGLSGVRLLGQQYKLNGQQILQVSGRYEDGDAELPQEENVMPTIIESVLEKITSCGKLTEKQRRAVATVLDLLDQERQGGLKLRSVWELAARRLGCDRKTVIEHVFRAAAVCTGRTYRQIKEIAAGVK